MADRSPPRSGARPMRRLHVRATRGPTLRPSFARSAPCIGKQDETATAKRRRDEQPQRHHEEHDLIRVAHPASDPARADEYEAAEGQREWIDVATLHERRDGDAGDRGGRT